MKLWFTNIPNNKLRIHYNNYYSRFRYNYIIVWSAGGVYHITLLTIEARCINIQERQRSPQPLPLGALVLAGLEGSALWLPLRCRPHTTFILSLYVVGYHINRLLLFCRVFHIPMSKVWLSSPNTFVTNSFLLGCPAPSWADGISWPPKSWVWPPTCLIFLFSLHDWGVPSKEACAADDVAIFVWCCCFYQAHILCSGQYQRKQSIQFYWRRSVHGDS